MSFRVVVVSAMAMSIAAGASAQNRVGSEFRVSKQPDTWDGPTAPAVARGPNGDLLVVWSSYGQDGSQSGVFGQRLGLAGVRQGGEFQINTYTTGDQSHPLRGPSVGGWAGGYVVVWRSDGQDGSNDGVFAQRYDAAGAALGGEFEVNDCTGGSQDSPDVAQAPDGRFVVVWTSSHNNDVCPAGLIGRRYAASGEPLGRSFLIHNKGAYRPRVQSDAAGNFVVVWQQGGWDILAQQFWASGERKGPRFLVNTAVSDVSSKNPRVSVSARGDFVIAWTGDGPSVRGQRFDAAGWRAGSEFEVVEPQGPVAASVSLAQDGRGGFLVSWTDGLDVLARRYDAGGPVGPPFRVNTYTRNDQRYGAVAIDGAGNFIVAWASDNDLITTDHAGIYAQRFSGAKAQLP